MSAKHPLDNIKITSPCTADWNSMTGNDHVRFCRHCNLAVHDLSTLTRKQALRIISKSQGRLCVRYMVRPDETVKARSSSLVRIGRRTSRIAAGAFGATIAVSGAASAPVASNRSLSPSKEWSFAQSYTSPVPIVVGGVIRGFIFDPTGAVIPNAVVSLSNQQSKLALSSVTSGDGEYRFDGLEPGEYMLKFEAAGFSINEVKGTVSRADSEERIDQTLGIAPIQAEVEIQDSERVIMGGASLALASDPLVRAAQHDDLELLKQLLAGRPNVNVRDERTGSTALEHAVLSSNREMAQLLIWAGAVVNTRDHGGRTPLMLLGEKTTSDAVWDLINAGAKVNLRDEDGDTALIEAAVCNNLEVLKVLLDAGAKVNAKNNEGRTALMQAAAEGLVNNVRSLILAGADVNARDAEGNSAWTLAAENDQAPVLRLLRSYGAEEISKPQQED